MREIWYKASGRPCPSNWVQYGPERPPERGEVTKLTHNGTKTIWTTVSKWMLPPLFHDLVPIDLGISDLVAACNSAGYHTEHSCSGLAADHVVKANTETLSPYICFSRWLSNRQQEDLIEATIRVGSRYRISQVRGTPLMRVAVYFSGHPQRFPPPPGWDEHLVKLFTTFGLALGLPFTE